MTDSHSYKSSLFISAVITVLTLVTFMHVLSADFVMWDDDRMVYQNSNLTGPGIEHLGWIFTHIDVTRRYTPLAALNYSITYQLWKLNPFGYHLSPWLFHGLNAGLVFFVLRILLVKICARQQIDISPGRITAGAALGALIWSLHPLRTETTAWVGANFYSQAMFFLLLSLLCYLSADNDQISSKSHLRRIFLSAVLFAAALLSHPIVIGFFVVLIALDIYPLGKLRLKWWTSAEGRRTLLEKIPFISVGLIITLITVMIRVKDNVVYGLVPLSEFSLFERFMQAMYILAYYIWRPFYPVNLAPVYTSLVDFNAVSAIFIASAITVIGGIILLIIFRRRWLGALMLTICYLALLVPVLGVFEHPHYSNDRYSLIVSLCLSVAVAVFLIRLKSKPIYYAAFFILLIIIITLAALSFRQTRIWKNTPALFEHILSTLGEDSYAGDIYYRFGSYYLQQPAQENWTKALSCFNKAAQIRPMDGDAWLQIGFCHSNLGQWSDSINAFQQAIRINPESAKAYYNIGLAYLNLGRLAPAINVFERTVKIAPDYADAYSNLGVCYAGLTRWPQAIEAFKNAVKIKPDFIDAHLNLGIAYLNIGDKDSAMAQHKALETLDEKAAGELLSLISK
ncbi:MAG: tetratricopeptide repeat protein [Sedimentisphaerales bacterium]|nr:tetratricopeptide repeat protein [Sedimentisphaerales bacterium]